MNATQQMLLAAALADALEKAGIVIEKPYMQRGNVKGWQRIDSGAVAARTIGVWMSWGFTLSCVPTLVPPAEPAPASTDSAQRALRLVTEDEMTNIDRRAYDA